MVFKMDKINNIDYQSNIYKSPANQDFQAIHNAKTLLRIVGKYIKSPVLDVGAGGGQLVEMLRQKNYTANGIDIVPNNKIVKFGSITDIPVQSGNVKTIFCTEILEHLDNEQITSGLKEINRVMQSGGFFFVTVPYKENFSHNMVACPCCSEVFHRYGHLQIFDEDRLNNLLIDNGFQIIKQAVYALGAMSKLPLGRFLNFIFKRIEYKSLAKTLVTVAKKK